MKLIDISRCVQEAPIYPGSPPIQIEQVFDMKKGDSFNESMITTGSHIGTHADAFRHFLKDNAAGIDQMDLRHYFGACHVLTVPESVLITRAILEGRIDKCERLVIHSGGKSYLTKDAADYIVEKEIVTVVTDAWSVAPLDNETEIHALLMGAGIAIIENTTLDGVDDGDYTLCAFPVKIKNCDGAPVRAVLIKG